MPRIPTFVSSQTPSGQLSAPGVRPTDFSGIARAADAALSAGEELRRAQDAERKRIEHNEAVSYVANTTSQADIDYREKFAQWQNEDPAGLSVKALEDFDAYSTQKIDAAPEAAKQSLRVQFANMRNRLHGSAFNIEAQGRQAAVLQADDEGTQSDARAVMSDPGLFNDKLALRTAATNQLDIPPALKAKRLSSARDQLVMAAATGYAQQYPNETLAALGEFPNSPHYDQGTQKAVLQAIVENKGILPNSNVVPGMVKSGNIDISDRPRVKNSDGSISTVRSMSTNIDGREVLIPTVSDDGRVMSDSEAIAQYKKTGKMLGVFDSIESADAYAQALHDQQAAALGEATTHPALGMLPFDRVDDIARIARATIERGVSTLRIDLSDRAKDVQAAVSSGLPVGPADVAGLEQQYVQAYGPAMGPRRYNDEIGVPLAVGEQIGKLRGVSATERQALVAQSAPNGVEGAADQARVHDAMLKADAIIAKQLKDDPAGYALTTSPDVKAAYQGLANATTPEQIQAANDAYAIATRAEQTRLGTPSVALLTASQTDAYGKRFAEAKPQDMVDLTSGLQMAWGRNYPTIYSQLARENKLPPAALVIPNMKDDGSKLRLAQASGLKQSELDSMVDPSTKKDLRTKLQEQFAPLAQTFAAQSLASVKTLDTIMSEAEKLGTYYMGTGKKPADAARQAFDEVAGWHYEFTDTYRVPKEEAPKEVQTGAQMALRDIGRLKLFDSPYPMGAANRARQSLDAVKTNAFWATNEDETGLVLKVKGNDNADYTAYKEDGKRVEYKWSELRRVGADVQSSEVQMRQQQGRFELEATKRRQQAEEQERLRRLQEAGMR